MCAKAQQQQQQQQQDMHRCCKIGVVVVIVELQTRGKIKLDEKVVKHLAFPLFYCAGPEIVVGHRTMSGQNVSMSS